MGRYKFTLGALVIAGGLLYLFASSVQQAAATHLTLASLLEQPEGAGFHDERIQLGGCTVVEGSIQWDQYNHRPRFTVTDGERALEVRYTGSGVVPDTFKDKCQVVLEGYYDAAARVFEAKVVLAKCPSKYEGKGYEGHVEAADDRPSGRSPW